jgi:hypothetical protein
MAASSADADGGLPGFDGGSCVSDEAAADIILVTCVKSKVTRPALAKDLYTSPLFKKQRAYAERAGVPWFILSAEHALVKPDEWLAPYERFLADTTPSYRSAWGAWVAARLELLAGPLQTRSSRSTQAQRISMRFDLSWSSWALGSSIHCTACRWGSGWRGMATLESRQAHNSMT